jgi:hypothetical protein
MLCLQAVVIGKQAFVVVQQVFVEFGEALDLELLASKA